VAVVPLLLLGLLAAAQLIVAGWALLSAGEAARAAARASYLGADADAAAARVLPGVLGRPTVSEAEGEVSVSVTAPALVPWLGEVPIAVSAALDPAAGAR